MRKQQLTIKFILITFIAGKQEMSEDIQKGNLPGKAVGDIVKVPIKWSC